MNHSDIRQLQAVTQSPCVTISLPTHRTAPDNLQDHIRVKNVVVQATERIISDYGKREVAPILLRLEQLVSEIDYQTNLDGLVLFVNHDIARRFVLAFSVPERVVVDDTFYTRDLVYGFNRTTHYWLVTLSENATRLFRATNDALEEVRNFGFPMEHTGAGGLASLPDGIGVHRSALRDEKHRQFFRDVDAGVTAARVQELLPVAVVGVDRFVAFYQEVSSHAAAIIATVKGSHDTTTTHQLAQLVWPIVKHQSEAAVSQALNELEIAVSGQRTISSVGEVWRVSNEGRAKHLFVERDFQYPARVDATGLQLTPVDDATAPGVLDDAVDEIITQVMNTGGQVTFVEPGTLHDHQHIAIITRY
jgi:hypothetical protein